MKKWVVLAGLLVATVGLRADLQLGDFEQYVRLFVQASKNNGLVNLKGLSNELRIENLKIEIGDLKQKEFSYITGKKTIELGECTTTDRITPTVVIDRKMWAGLSPTKKEMLLLHELGHCVLNRMKHKDTFIVIGGQTVPSSLMNTFIIDEKFYEEHRDYYLSELFSYREGDEK